MSLTRKAVELSNGAWVSNEDMIKTLGITSSQNPLRNIATSKSIISEVVTDSENNYVRYRAYYHEDKTPIELAKMRKNAGVLAGIESIKFGSKEA
ncbi:MAG: hypothetical protein CL600_08015 [Alteromonas sp.]|nr:hypothetical protein [Alteromonas sp.]